MTAELGIYFLAKEKPLAEPFLPGGHDSIGVPLRSQGEAVASWLHVLDTTARPLGQGVREAEKQKDISILGDSPI